MSFSRFNLALRLQGYPMTQAYAYLNSLVKLPEGRTIQDSKKWEIYKYHLCNNSFYCEFHDIANPQVWEDIPILRKINYRSSTESVVTSKFRYSKLYESKTSGSSGQPLIFWKCKLSHAIAWASILTAYSNLGINESDFQARFYAIGLGHRDYYKDRLKDWLAHRYRFVIHDLSATVLRSFITVFQRKKFKWVYGYTNSILEFCRYLDHRRLVLRKICPTLKTCVVTAEMCSPESGNFIERVLGVPVINEYGCSEFGVIGLRNSNQHWAINCDHLYVEIVDKHGRQVSPGQSGKIVVTDLFNQAMPFVRYDTGDVGTLAADGRNISKLLGRENDFLRTESGKTVPGFTFYYVVKDVLSIYPDLLEYNIVQTSLKSLRFNLRFKDQAKVIGLQQSLQRLVGRYLGEEMTVEVKIVKSIDRSTSGKTRHFVALQDDELGG